MSWLETTLGELIDIKHGFAFKSEFFSDEGQYVVLTPGNCHNEGGFKDKGDKEKRYTGEIPESYLLKEGDLLVVMTDLVNSAPVLGGSFLIPKDDIYLHNQRLGLVTVKTDAEADKKFIYYLLNTHSYRGQVRGSASGATVRHTAPDRIRGCKVLVPSTKEHQERIASILSTYDDLIENNRRRMALLEEAARLLYREWFVQLRFPGHEHIKIVDSVPEGWERRTLGDVVNTNPESYKAGKLPEILSYIDISSVSTGKIDTKTEMAAADAPGRARRKVRDGDVIWSNVRPNLRAYSLVIDPAENDVFSTGFTVLRSKLLNPWFMYFFVTSNAFVEHLINHATGTSYPAVRPEDFEKAEVIVPPTALLDEFGEICRPQFQQIAKLHSQALQAGRARDLLLPRLMDGRIEV